MRQPTPQPFIPGERCETHPIDDMRRWHMGWLNIREAPKRPLGTTATPRTTALPHATPSPHSSIGTTGASRRWPLGARVHPAASVLPARRTPRLAPPRPHSRWDAGSRWWSGLQIGGGCGGRYSARTWRRYRKRRARGAPMPTPSRASPDAPLAILRPTRPWPPQGCSQSPRAATRPSPGPRGAIRAEARRLRDRHARRPG